ncbi:MAG: bifunctional 2-C-methyl-D-erythritol 4-phosphate cytidylyltransferase/2-C-methyl-D-erythritol 2,4-cyclodiphosphate synthase [Novosphingobium sp.]|uniref:bifunctional 2-C-methyl-D-erythritol 4-phosphate cytidylyltransferase/2-C-methyl-D-erythritol 2,4-cyclodiphosphate synthase n=1 Tax=Novosphingobium sp. TaxID=1874826 RepID=UPI001DCEC886|nr:bifunctional 2-C-methyl-D-erythritol 4-phosphate cytidylyltransferase/2-C-methyl-D-erythritol 2,4-cyclodiphosphate synthase [Novosphingobium sp.]MCB2057198.1 bifunctional 2-C-methyl-D-erythritol 4-phosphate cytidylyltransferase/2-C-methyl-D-erythritol 2,4-cyclodiphosphate synthase [Novosphingobium sp.]MCP5387990.1 bifunctional 2-C-methyl-D-erythritol 4-phosphate cytidylyltransferase/2-C-methyl-D-erythritol 2,4-cyclodiphosphate synthase [Novosphingobium sp.]
MSDPGPPLPTCAAVIVAAGQGLRAGQPLPKQFALWRGKPVVRHSAEALAAAGIAPIVVAIPAGAQDQAGAALAGIAGIRLIEGGATRQQSVSKALAALEADAPATVLIHDAARPCLPQTVIDRLIAALAVQPGAIPVLPVVDSLAHTEGTLMGMPARREALRRVQTPQAFRYSEILAAHRAWDGPADAGDDAQVAQAAGLTVALVEGDEALHKLTVASDFEQARPAMRVGTGYDVHRLADGEELWLCGVKIDLPRGLAGHSDADVAIHALVDAILGALGRGDIGSHFPPSDPQWKGAASEQFLRHAVELAGKDGYRVGNTDVTIVCEAPKIGPHREAMRAALARIMGVDIAAVSVKATTTERLGFAGRGEGIAAQAAVLLQQD